MSTRGLFFGIALILAFGVAAWLLVRPDRTGVDAARREAPDESERILPQGTHLENDRAVIDVPPDSVQVLGPGDAAPNFELEMLQGGSFELAHHRGHVVVLNFWATWCEPCRDEMADLVMTQDSLEDAGVLVAGVSLDEEGREIVAAFHETFPVDYPLLLNGLDVAARYGAHYVVPTTFVIDGDGLIVDRFDGAVVLEEILPRLRAHVSMVDEDRPPSYVGEPQ